MTDLDSMLADLDPLGRSDVPAATSAVAQDLYRHLLAGVGTGPESGASRVPVSSRSRLRHPRRIVVALLLVAISVGVVVPAVVLHLRSGHGPASSSHATTSTSTSTSTSVKVGPPPPPPVSRAPWPAEVLASHLDVDQFSAVAVPGTPYVVSTEQDQCMEPCSVAIVRLDVETGAVLVGPIVSAYSSFDIVDGSPVLVTAHQVRLTGTVVGGWELRSLDLATLRLGPVLRLPFLGDSGFSYTQGVSPTSPDVWMAAGTALWLVDTTTGRIVRQVRPAIGVSMVSLAPDDGVLYALCRDRSGTGSGVPVDVCELDPLTGSLRAEVAQPDASNSVQLTATNGGVWATDAFGGVWLWKADGLGRVDVADALPPDARPAGYRDPITPTDLGPFMLLEGAQGMTCVDPDTGTLRAEARYPAAQAPSWSAVETSGDRLLVIGGGRPSVGIGDYLSAVGLPHACFG